MFSQGMSSIKNKYKKTIPTNITSLEPKTEDDVEKAFSKSETSAKKHIFALRRLI